MTADQPDIVVTISEDVPDEQREAIRASVATMARRSADAARAASEQSRASNARSRRMYAPIRALIESDPDAAAALAEAEDAGRSAGRLTTPRAVDWPTVTLAESDRAPLFDHTTGPQVFQSPWHYQWQWFSGQPASTSSQDRTTGQITIGCYANQDANRSEAHGGFGVAMTTDRVQAVTGRSLRRSTHAAGVIAGSLGGNATAEGGMEMTALENGTLLAAVQDKRFRIRTTNGDDDRVDDPGFETGDAVEVDWVMQPGRTYTFNVGCWVFCEAHGGLGTSSVASARVDGLVSALTTFLTD